VHEGDEVGRKGRGDEVTREERVVGEEGDLRVRVEEEGREVFLLCRADMEVKKKSAVSGGYQADQSQKE